MASDKAATEPPVFSPADHPETVLIVDDEGPVRRTFPHCLPAAPPPAPLPAAPPPPRARPPPPTTTLHSPLPEAGRGSRREQTDLFTPLLAGEPSCSARKLLGGRRDRWGRQGGHGGARRRCGRQILRPPGRLAGCPKIEATSILFLKEL